MVDGHPQRTTQDLPFEKYFDEVVTWPVFSMYSKITGEEDSVMADRWKADADGVLIFVSARAGIHISLPRLNFHRVVCSLPPLQRCSV